MIRAVAVRFAARAKPAYVGRHRRAKPVLQRVFRMPAQASGPAAEMIEH
ncbi:hypothetical protein AB0B28_05210 [Glycomyces sp. NPDC046736]